MKYYHYKLINKYMLTKVRPSVNFWSKPHYPSYRGKKQHKAHTCLKIFYKCGHGLVSINQVTTHASSKEAISFGWSCSLPSCWCPVVIQKIRCISKRRNMLFDVVTFSPVTILQQQQTTKLYVAQWWHDKINIAMSSKG